MGSSPTAKTTLLPGPVIVGAGPSGLAVAACLADLGIRAIVLEKSLCIASLWQNRTYDRLKLHLPKQFCELPLLGFPKHFPKYPSKQQFISYMESYASAFSISPRFGCEVISAEHDATTGLWRIRTSDNDEQLLTRWLVVATGENAEAVDPDVAGKDKFAGKIMHTCSYKSGAEFEGEKVLVVGCGNSGMEVCLDLHRHNAEPHMVVRNTVHVLPREMFGMSTFGLTMSLLRWLPVRMVDKVLLTAAQFTLGDTDRIGLRRPKAGPIELKNLTGKTPVLDVGALSLIKSGKIKVMVEVKEITKLGAKFVDGKEEEYDSIILATGYRSNVPSWLKGCGGDGLFSEDGMPNDPYPNGWKGVKGLYCVGFTRRGLLGTSADARNIARDVYLQIKRKSNKNMSSSNRTSHMYKTMY